MKVNRFFCNSGAYFASIHKRKQEQISKLQEIHIRKALLRDHDPVASPVFGVHPDTENRWGKHCFFSFYPEQSQPWQLHPMCLFFVIVEKRQRMAYMCLPGKSGRQGSLYWYAFVYLERTWMLKGTDKETDVKKHIFFFFFFQLLSFFFFFLILLRKSLQNIIYILYYLYMYTNGIAPDNAQQFEKYEINISFLKNCSYFQNFL